MITNRFSNIIKAIPKLTLEELRFVKQTLDNKIHKKNIQAGNTSTETRLYNILKSISGHFRYGSTDYEEMLKRLTEYTEEEFLKWNSVGIRTVEMAKQELEKRGLSFKTELITISLKQD